jgi:hypothetical protein
MPQGEERLKLKRERDGSRSSTAWVVVISGGSPPIGKPAQRPGVCGRVEWTRSAEEFSSLVVEGSR